MKNSVLKIYIKAQTLRETLKDESGQDLIEYALVVSLIAFAAIAGMGTLANGINNAFKNIANTLASAA